MQILTGKRLLVTGVVTTDSIAFAVAERAQRQGADVVLSTFDRARPLTEEAAAELPHRPDVIDLDVTRAEDYEAAADWLRRERAGLDGVLHAVAFAPRDALAGDFLSAPPHRVQMAFETSTYSFAPLAKLLADLAPAHGGSIVGLDFGSQGAWPVYNWMGVCKAALGAVNRYVARELGPAGIRSNLVAAGPLHTRAAGGIPDFHRLTDAWEATSPLPWDPTDATPVADAVCFLLSDLARAVTGEILNVDGGYHAMATALRPAAAAEGRVAA